MATIPNAPNHFVNALTIRFSFVGRLVGWQYKPCHYIREDAQGQNNTCSVIPFLRAQRGTLAVRQNP